MQLTYIAANRIVLTDTPSNRRLVYMMVYTNTRFKHKKKRKVNPAAVAKKLTKAQLARICSHDTTPLPTYRVYDRSIPSLKTNAHNTDRKEIPVYSGERELLGVGVMHKSNLVPIFKDNKQVAEDIAKMRRN